MRRRPRPPFETFSASPSDPIRRSAPNMPTLPSKADKIHKLASQLQYNIDNWDAHHREEDRTAIITAVQTMKKYLDDVVTAMAAPSK
jgi:hypothetical protein